MGLYKMLTARKKIQKEGKAEPDAFEDSVAQALFDLEVSATELTKSLRELYITSAKKLETGDRSVILIFVPFRLLDSFHKIQARLVRELEKKFSGSHVVIIANRKIVRPDSRKQRQARQKVPRSRTLTSVHESILDDVCYPAEIVGKRIRYRVDGSKTLKV